jgi:hypothetical protein
MDKYKNGHYSSYLDNIPRTWTGNNGHYSTYLDNIPRTWTRVRMVTIAPILTIYCKSINFRCIQFSRFLPTGQIHRYPFLHISYCTKAKEMYFSVNQFISRQRFILTRLNGITYYICHVKSAHSVLS